MGGDPLIGTKLGRFLIQETLGSGGMGTVYRALQEGLDRPVAVKVLHSGRQNTTFLKRFLREAKSAAQVSHANVVQVYTAGVHEGVHYIAMEYVQGTSVGEEIDRRGALPEKEILSAGLQAASGLQAAWKRGLVHRDVKPDNLLVLPDGTVKVADFGLAKGAEAQTRLTQDKVTIGTIAYMSPEQIRGGKVDARSDIYALGATLYHMAAGRPPFVGEGAVVMAYQHLNEPPQLLRELRPAVSSGLEAVVHRMMAKAPEDRYPDYESVLQDLSALETTGHPSSGVTMEHFHRLLVDAGPPRRSRRFTAIVGAALLLAAVATIAAVAVFGKGGRGDGAPDGKPVLPPSPSGLDVEAPAEGAILPSLRVEVKGAADPTAVQAVEINGTQVPLLAGRFGHEVWLDPDRPRIRIKALRFDGGTEEVVRSVRVDTQPPEIEIREPAGGVLYTREAVARVEGIFRDENPKSLRADGAALSLADGRFALEVPVGDEGGAGETRIVFVGEDQAGNRVEAEVVVIRDLAPPQIEIRDLPRFVDGGDGVLPLVFEVNEPLSSLTVNGEAKAPHGLLYEMKLALREGVNEIGITATDLAGNTENRVDVVHFRPYRPPTPAELQGEYEETIRRALEAEPRDGVRILEEYIALHPEGPFTQAAQRQRERLLVEAGRLEEAQRLEEVATQAAAAEDPFEAIALWRSFLEGREGPAADQARRQIAMLKRKDLDRENMERTVESGVYRNLRDDAEMVRVASGYFLRGLPPAWEARLKKHYVGSRRYEDEQPAAEVFVDAFYIYRHEVTNAMFARFLRERGSAHDEEGHPLVQEHPLGLVRVGKIWEPAPGRNRHPVICVSWYGAVAYAAWAGGRLPREAEWEKAASWDAASKTKFLFPWGTTYRHGAAVCADLWFAREIKTETELELFHDQAQDASDRRPAPVDSHPGGASPAGCLHMAGNVAEWCFDVYDREFYLSENSRFRNPFRSGGGTLRSVRGGSWKGMCRDARTMDREGIEPGRMDEALGFRVVR